MSDIFNFADTWNNAGTAFRGMGLDVHNGSGGTPVYAAGSRVLRFTKDGSETSSIGLDGQLFQTPTQTSQSLWEIDPALTDADGTKYGALWGVSDQNDPDPRANTLFNIGYNPARFFSANEPALSISWESYYVPPGNDPAMEWHLAFNSDDGLVATRMLSALIPRDGVSITPRPQFSINASILRLSDFAGNQRLAYNLYSTTAEIFHEGDVNYQFSVNNVPVHYQKSSVAGGSVNLPLPYYAAEDQLIFKRYIEVSTERSVGDSPTDSMVWFDAGAFMVNGGYLFRGRWTNNVTGSVKLIDLSGQATGDATTFLSNSGTGRTLLDLYSAAAGSDSLIILRKESGGALAFGIDVSDSNAIVLSASNSALGSNNRLRIDANTVGFPTLPIKVPSIAVASLPSAATVGAGSVAYANNAAAPCLVFSDGTNWKRCDNAATTVT